jgi:hypothetical protein
MVTPFASLPQLKHVFDSTLITMDDVTGTWTMSDYLMQYRINSNWRYHVLQFIETKKKNLRRSLHNEKKVSFTTLDYCNGDQEYASVLDTWLEFMKEEERLYFYKYLATQCIDEARRSLDLLLARKHTDSDIRMPLLRDVITSYSRPFKESHGRLNKKYRLNGVIGIPSPEEVHNKILSDRDQAYAHCDLSVKAARTSRLGGFSVRAAGYDWLDYERLLPSMVILMDSALSLIRQYVSREGMDDEAVFFQRFEDKDDQTTKEPELLNQLYGNE